MHYPRARTTVGLILPVFLATTMLTILVSAQTATWNSAGTMSTPRYSHTATLLQDGTVLVAGGASGSAALATAEIYNPTSNSWIATGSMANGRSGHSATLLSDGRVLVTGGGAGATAEIYNPLTHTWSATGSLNAIRLGQSASLLGNGMVLVAGGCCASDGFTSLNSAELWNPATGTWTATGNMASTHAYHTATVLSDGTVLVQGGTFYRTGTSASSEIYNPSSGTWSGRGELERIASLVRRQPSLKRSGSRGRRQPRRLLLGRKFIGTLRSHEANLAKHGGHEHGPELCLDGADRQWNRGSDRRWILVLRFSELHSRQRRDLQLEYRDLVTHSQPDAGPLLAHDDDPQRWHGACGRRQLFQRRGDQRTCKRRALLSRSGAAAGNDHLEYRNHGHYRQRDGMRGRRLHHADYAKLDARLQLHRAVRSSRPQLHICELE